MFFAARVQDARTLREHVPRRALDGGADDDARARLLVFDAVAKHEERAHAFSLRREREELDEREMMANRRREGFVVVVEGLYET